VVHYEFEVPPGVRAPITATLKLQYRKFDHEFMAMVYRQAKPGDNAIEGGIQANASGQVHNTLPVLTLASDTVTFPIDGLARSVENKDRDIPVWQRWNDYGIGLFLEGKAELKQAEDAFRAVEKLNRFDGPINLARVYLREGRIDEAAEAVQRAAQCKDPIAPEWSVAWFSGLVNREEGRLDQAIENFRNIVDRTTPERVQRGFDFSRDYEVLNALGRTLIDRAEQLRGPEQDKDRNDLLKEAATAFERTLAIDQENVNAHYNLGLIYGYLQDAQRERHHKELHLRYKSDDNAQGLAVRAAREKYPHANYAAESLVIYPLQRKGVPELPGSDDGVPHQNPSSPLSPTGAE
jgi:tetratricopeptide (TPR) repeat protein